MGKFTGDFETTTDEKDCRVWAYGICEIGNNNNFIYGNNIEDFINWCKNEQENHVLYFHNLKFDGEFIFSYLLTHDYHYVEIRKGENNTRNYVMHKGDEEIELNGMQDKTFTCLISDLGLFYSIEIYFEKKGKRVNKVTIYDSLKILNFSVEKIAKCFNLPIQKLELDYDKKREVGHKLTVNEVNYLRNDVEIMSRALDIMFHEGLTKMTIGSNALNHYKKILKSFNQFFPIIPKELYDNLKTSYKGGFTYLNPLYENKKVVNEVVFDVNSLYPSTMKNELLCYGKPVFFIGKYEKNSIYPLYIQQITCRFKLKKGKIPSIQIKNNLFFKGNEYLIDSDDRIVTLNLTNIDLDLFLEQYDVENLNYECGFMFKGTRGLFNIYIDEWSNKKIEAKKEGNDALYTISKLMLNSLYGKFGTGKIVRGKYPYLKEDDSIGYHLTEGEEVDGVYVPLSSFVTSYARNKTIRTSQKIRDWSVAKFGIDKYIYSDTDSIHANLDFEFNENHELVLADEYKELYDIIDIDDFRLGAWKVESAATEALYLRQKCYIQKCIEWNKKEEKYIDYIKSTVAGLPKDLGKNLNFDNFNLNFTCNGKLTPKHVKGGIVLVDTTFSIKM